MYLALGSGNEGFNDWPTLVIQQMHLQDSQSMMSQYLFRNRHDLHIKQKHSKLVSAHASQALCMRPRLRKQCGFWIASIWIASVGHKKLHKAF